MLEGKTEVRFYVSAFNFFVSLNIEKQKDGANKRGQICPEA